jgi:1-hydroxycarotenoid 3,4-desaturase
MTITAPNVGASPARAPGASTPRAPTASATTPRVAIIGAGIAGLSAAIDLARAGIPVTVFERAAAPGGKMREVAVAGRELDAGPTVFTLRDVFDQLYADAGANFSDQVNLLPANVLARHAWNSHEHLDLYADLERSADAIAAFAGPAERTGFLRFAAQAQRIYTTLNLPFMRSSRPTPLGLGRRIGLGKVTDLMNIQPFTNLFKSISTYFADPRLRQLFARYATYCGSSPYQSPATLMLIAHVEQAGVWYIEGGMHSLAKSLAAMAQSLGAEFRYQTEVAAIHLQSGRVAAVETRSGERHACTAVVSNADNNALATGLFGREAASAVRATALQARSLSALTWNLVATTAGFELARHTVFFGGAYRSEFEDIFQHRRLPLDPTVYVCAQDRYDGAGERALGPERLLCLVNAPPIGDRHEFGPAEIERCEIKTFERLEQCGLRVARSPQATQVTTPSDFERLFPATGGALYGPASHGWTSSFTRPGSRSKIPGLYLAGGSTHPGAGVPMAAISGRLAAASVLADCASTARSRPVATPGGTSMP